MPRCHGWQAAANLHLAQRFRHVSKNFSWKQSNGLFPCKNVRTEHPGKATLYLNCEDYMMIWQMFLFSTVLEQENS